MLIKVDGGYLDFDDQIEVEKQIKLFEDIATSDGDFSYAFEVERTANNTRLFNNPMPDVLTKPVYQKIPASLINNEGTEAYTGYIRIERITKFFECSFFSGNNNWFGLLSGPISDIDFSSYDLTLTSGNIQSTFSNTEGVVFPLVDNGALLTRGINQLKIEDMVAGIYVKTIVKKIMRHHSIKLEGELLDHPEYNRLVILKNGENQTAIEERSAYVFSNDLFPVDGTFYQIEFTDVSTYPYFVGAQNNISQTTDRYTADVRMRLKIELSNQVTPLFTYMRVFKNGVTIPGSFNANADGIISGTLVVELDTGDYIDIRMSSDPLGPIVTNAAKIRFTPEFVYKAFGNSIVPKWTQQEFVSNVIRIFNVLPSYNSKTGTLTLNLLDRIKDKDPIDLSPYIESTEVDYVEFIGNYGKMNLLSYQEVDAPEFREYNVKNFFRYAQGNIEADNDFLDDTADALESEFSNPIAYINRAFDMSMERLNLIEIESDETVDVTSVTDNSGVARFNIPEDIFVVGDLVRISESTNEGYNGDWVVSAIGSGYIELYGVPFNVNATGKADKMVYNYGNTDDVYLLRYIPSYSVSNFSGNSFVRLETTNLTTVSTAFFALLNTGRTIDDDFIQSLSFGGIDNEAFTQRTLIQSNFNLFSRVLNDPVKLLCAAYLPHNVFKSIDFLRPATIKSIDTSNMYYVNRVSGYGHCTIELIKLP